MKKLGIYGAGGLAREVLELAKTINDIEHRWDDYVFVDIEPSDHLLNGTQIVSEEYVFEYKNDIEAVIAVGEPALRNKIYDKIIARNVKLTNLIHPDVRISETTTLGKGVVVCAGTVITCNVTIDDNVYIHPHATIGHDICIGKHSNIGANTEIGGANILGERVFMGFLSGTVQGIEIGDDVEISAGAIVFRNVDQGLIVMGNPARVIRKNNGTGVFRKNGE